MSGEGATRKAALFELAAGSLAGHRHPELYRCYVPGRIEVLGKHTDYAGGRSLLCAAERGLCVVALPRDDGVVSVTDALNRQTAIFEFSADLAIQPGDWSVYPGTVVRRIARNFGPPLAGAEVAFASDLPRAAGMSSSSALVVAVFQALSAVNRLEERDEYRANIGSKEDLAAYLGCVENGQSYGSLIGDRGVGTFGGSEDHTAILCSRPGHLAQYSFCPVRFERSVKLPTDCTFVIGVSGVVADKIGSARDKYNLASRAAQAVLQSWRAASGSTAATLAEAVANSSEVEEIWKALRQASSDGFDSAALLNRFEQFLLESMTIVPQVGAALESADLSGVRRTGGPIANRRGRAAWKSGSRDYRVGAQCAVSRGIRGFCLWRGIRRQRLGLSSARRRRALHGQMEHIVSATISRARCAQPVLSDRTGNRLYRAQLLRPMNVHQKCSASDGRNLLKGDLVRRWQPYRLRVCSCCSRCSAGAAGSSPAEVEESSAPSRDRDVRPVIGSASVGR